MDYYTNGRYTLDQELEADMLALRIMNECGLHLPSEDNYKRLLQILEREPSSKHELIISTPSISMRQRFLSACTLFTSAFPWTGASICLEKLRIHVQGLRKGLVEAE